jgi:hypothetical protein
VNEMRTMRARPAPLKLAVLVVVATANATADDALATRLRQCAAVSDSMARLACYDALARPAAASTPPSSAPAAVAPTAKAAPASEATGATTAPVSPTPVSPASPASPASPGSTAPPAAASSPRASLEDFGVRNGPLQAKREPPGEQKMLAVVTQVSSLPRGELIVTLDNGQIWVQLEPGNFPVKAGDPIEIDVAALGSYRMWQPVNRHASKVTRIH